GLVAGEVRGGGAADDGAVLDAPGLLRFALPAGEVLAVEQLHRLGGERRQAEEEDDGGSHGPGHGGTSRMAVRGRRLASYGVGAKMSVGVRQGRGAPGAAPRPAPHGPAPGGRKHPPRPPPPGGRGSDGGARSRRRD